MPSIYVNGNLIAKQYESITTLTASTGLTSTKYDTQLTTLKANDVAWSKLIRAEEVLITVEVASIRWTVDGTTPQTTAGGGAGHNAVNGSNITIQGYENITKFRCINETASSGAGIRVTYFFRE